MYSTPVDVRAVLSHDGNTSDYDSPSHYADDQILDAIKRADSRIDLHLRSRYFVPVATPDDLLRDYSSVLAAYFLTLTESNNSDLQKDDPIRLRFDSVMEELKMILAGTLVLPYPIEDVDSINDAAVFNHGPEGDLFIAEEFLSGDIYNWPVGYRCLCNSDGTRCDCG